MKKAKCALAYYRKRALMNQEEVAAKIGIDRSTVAKWETGKAMPRPDRLRELAKMYGCTMENLMEQVTA